MFGSTTAATGGSNGFISDIFGPGFQAGWDRIGSDLLPIWAADQLRVQSQDQLAQPTFDASKAPPRNNDGMRSTTDPVAAPAADAPRMQPSNDSAMWMPLVLIGAVLVGLAVIKK